MVIDLIAGHDNVLPLRRDAADGAGVGVEAHGDEGELLIADAQVALQPPAAGGRAHLQHLLPVLGPQEGLGVPVAQVVLLDEALPLVLIKRVGLVGGDVVLQEDAVHDGCW